MENDSPAGFMRLDAVLKVLAMSRSTWLLGIKRGIYPKPFRISPRRIAWKKIEIEKLIDDITSGRAGG
jgi:predicted DNA-binding transcriptional regulator AlpA